MNTTCRYFRKGSCKHGMKGRECRYTHPKVCSKFTQHGTRKDRGCNLGKRCKYFHPQMCLESLRKGQCFSTKCPFNHIKGTKRHPSVIENKVESVSPQSQIKTTDVLPSPDKNEDSKQKQDDHKQYDTGHFLEFVRLLKAEILQTLDSKITALTSQLQLLQPQAPQLFPLPPMSQQMIHPTMPPPFFIHPRQPPPPNQNC